MSPFDVCDRCDQATGQDVGTPGVSSPRRADLVAVALVPTPWTDCHKRGEGWGRESRSRRRVLKTLIPVHGIFLYGLFVVFSRPLGGGKGFDLRGMCIHASSPPTPPPVNPCLSETSCFAAEEIHGLET